MRTRDFLQRSEDDGNVGAGFWCVSMTSVYFLFTFSLLLPREVF
jgi:hypothetical protein